MSRSKTKNTSHSYLRAIERIGLKRKDAEELMRRAQRNGKTRLQLNPGPIQDFITKKAGAGKRVKVYKDYVFIFCKTSTKCLTMYPLSEELKKEQEEYDRRQSESNVSGEE